MEQKTNSNNEVESTEKVETLFLDIDICYDAVIGNYRESQGRPHVLELVSKEWGYSLQYNVYDSYADLPESHVRPRQIFDRVDVVHGCVDGEFADSVEIDGVEYELSTAL